MNERGSQCTYEGKRSSKRGEKKKEKPQTRWQGRCACADSRKKGTPSRFASKRGSLCTCEKGGTVRRKEKKKKKPHHSTCIALDSGGGRRAGEVAEWSDHAESRGVREVPYVPVRRSAKNEKKKEKEKREGSSQSPERRRVTERGKGKCMSQSNVGREGASKSVVQREGAATCRRRRVMGRRGRRLRKFPQFSTCHKVSRGNFPKKCHVTYS